MKRIAALAFVLGACGDNVGVCNVDGLMCERLSSWDLFDDIAAQRPAPGVMPYDVATPLFSDYTTKQRFLRLPEGGVATWGEDGAIDLPIGSILVKTFSFDTHLETRLLVHGATGWHGASYIYGDDRSDATLAIAGALLDPPQDPGYAVPNQNQCKNCHAEHDDVVTPIGPKAGRTRHEMLTQMVDAGTLVGAPPESEWPRAIDAFDPASGSLDERARAWLDINCSYCHNPRGAARTSGLYLSRAELDLAKIGVCKPPVATGRGSGGRQYDIVPGQPDASILVYRIEATEPEIRMPELGRNLVHTEGVALIREWITAMTGVCGG